MHSSLPCAKDGDCGMCGLSSGKPPRIALEAQGISLPDPCPYIRLRDVKGGTAVEVGIKGTF